MLCSTPKVLFLAHSIHSFENSVWKQRALFVIRVACDRRASVYFPKLKEGDFLAWFDMGAYTGCLYTGFNGFPMPLYFYVPHGANVQR